ncbi:hypothetical protein [Mesorhizobium sp. M0816]
MAEPVGERFGVGGTVVLAGEICKRSSTRRTPSSLFRRAADASQGTGCRIRQGNVAVLGGVSSAFMLLAWAPFSMWEVAGRLLIQAGATALHKAKPACCLAVS